MSSSESLTLVPQSQTKGTRRLSCVVLRPWHTVTLMIRSMKAPVRELLTKASAHVPGDWSANMLQLFVARRDDGAWLVEPIDERWTLELSDQERQQAVMREFVKQRNAMAPNRVLCSYFPTQPPLIDLNARVIHVIIVTPDTYYAAPPSDTQVTTRVRMAHVAAALGCATKHTSSKSPYGKPRPMILRSSTLIPKLWLGTDDKSLHASMFISKNWQLLANDIFEWLYEGDGDDEIEVADMERVDGFFASPSVDLGRRVIVTGAPGVGKSVFLALLLYRLMQLPNPPVCVVDVPEVTFSRVDCRTGRVDEGERHRDFTDEFMDPDTVYMFDNPHHVSDEGVQPWNPLRASEVCARSIVVCQQRFTAMSTQRTRTFVVPLWTPTDVRLCRTHCYASVMTEQEASERCLRWGGIPRHIFDESAADVEAKMEQAIAATATQNILHALANAKLHHKSFADATTSLWAPLIVLTSRAANGFLHDRQVAFSSQYVCDRVMQRAQMPTARLQFFEVEHLPVLWAQIKKSLEYLAQEEEEKTEEAHGGF